MLPWFLFVSGTVAIWNLLSESVLLKELLSDERQTFRELKLLLTNPFIL